MTSSDFAVAITHLFKGTARLTTFKRPGISLQPSAVSELQQRLQLIDELHRTYLHRTRDTAADSDAWDALPPDDWMNERLAQLGRAWRVQTIDGFRYEFYDPLETR